ncbi:MAG: asparagine synthase (glutamine-hydrolyzing) [Candidatus Omnitrophica bacterium]|nr:asparagine synthase (glutamine-hydrolyzing) [Candidatus Omnitrophota bacterium]
MCGICGIIDLSSGKDLNSYIKSMMDKMAHRGPDDSGTFFDYKKNSGSSGIISIGLGHRRLSIIDLNSGHQPIHNEDKSIWIVLNGEIYNYLELRFDLEKQGHIFATLSDTEVVVHLYEQYGQDCVKHLRGMFAFAIWDVKNSILFIARDRAGKKPLVYYYKNGLFIFSSELSSLLGSGLIERELDPIALDYYLTLGYIPAPLTIFKNVFKLPHAHSIVLKNKELKVSKYWELEYYPKLVMSEQDVESELERIFEESVKIRLRSDVPLGSFLSGGVDSSAVVSMMSRLSNQKIKTFSIGFEEKDYSELKYAKNIARIFNTDHHEFVVKPDALQILPLLVERYGEPYADSSCIPTYYVSRETKKFVTVALSGDGGDESFAGYDRYYAMLVAEDYSKWNPFVRCLVGKISNLFPDSANSKNTFRRIKRFLAAAALPADERYLRWTGIWNSGLKEILYTNGFKGMIDPQGLESNMARFINTNINWHLVDRLLKTDVSNYLPYDLLTKVDIASMANSLEVRSPLLDHKFMEFAACLPVSYKLKGNIKKYIFKKYLEKFVPKNNLYRTKMGFAMPIGKWLRTDLRGFLKETLLASKALKRGYFNSEIVIGMVKQHISGKCDHSYQLWSLLMLELWHQKFFDEGKIA